MLTGNLMFDAHFYCPMCFSIERENTSIIEDADFRRSDRADFRNFASLSFSCRSWSSSCKSNLAFFFCRVIRSFLLFSRVSRQYLFAYNLLHCVFASNLRNYRLSPSSTCPAISRRIFIVTFLWCQLLTIEERFRRNDCDETLMDVFGTEVRAKNEDRPFPRQRSLSTLSFARINLDGAELYYNDSMSRFRGRPCLSRLVIWVNDEHTTEVIASRPFDRALLRSLPVCESALAWRLHYGVNVSNRYIPARCYV